ncbi:hypothetical protein [Actinomadura madurae]|uniref:hypothetical protein n=1 Tax=Actinomadura madurae TaxID=1993 RepID=UPI0020D20A01|nr:hypothetical protein [Actinomadura madurae]MCP9969219.1 hypothetical protein [Actinomadura madurae]MCP9981696.1 hypothetical protein [Actinomadura madurae]
MWFGERWITSVFDLFEENTRYFPSLLPLCDEEEPREVLDEGGIPELGELTLHNGTIYRWNRPIYAVVEGRPHLRVENRVLPAGPSVADVVANGAFYYGLVRMLAEADRPVWTRMSFATAEENLHRAARDGLESTLYWPGMGEVPAPELILRKLLPSPTRASTAGASTPSAATACSVSSSGAASPGGPAPPGRSAPSASSKSSTACPATTRCA